jgi:MIP family channel proteins
MKEACAEFLGTFFLVLCGNGVMASITLGRLGQEATIVSAFGWGLSLGIGIWISGSISGGHLNPAVTTAMAVMRKCSWKKVIPYLVAQYLASFLAASAVFLVYHDGIAEFDLGTRQLPPSVNSTAQIFATYPKDSVSTGTLFADQVIGTCLLLIVICTATDSRSGRSESHLPGLIIGLGLTAIALAFGHNCGAPLNPARDFSPRFFTAIAGWGFDTFSFRNYTWFWIPIVAPHVGALLGVWLYDFFIDMPFRNYALLDEVEVFNVNDRLERITTESPPKSSIPPVFGSLSPTEKSLLNSNKAQEHSSILSAEGSQDFLHEALTTSTPVIEE